MSGFWAASREALLEEILGRNLLDHVRAERRAREAARRETARQYAANYMANERILKELEKSA